MSRIGKQPVELPDGVKTAIANGAIEVQGPKGKLSYSWGTGVTVVQEDKTIVVKLEARDRQARCNYGTTRSHISNMVEGVTNGYQKALELSGVGFNANLKGNTLVLQTGYSHDVELEVPKGIECKTQKTKIELSSHDKELIGTFAATVRRVCPPEPYLGKGIKYEGEQIRRKAGKTGK